MLITDAQYHLFEANTPERPWPDRDGWRPIPQFPSFTAERMLAEMDAIGVDRAVIVPPTWASDDNDAALAAAAKYPKRFAVMGRIDPFLPGQMKALETWREQPGMLGIRMTFRIPSRPLLFTDLIENGALDDFWAACERSDIPIMCLTQEKPHLLNPIAARHPGLTLIVDHLASIHGETVEASFVAIEDLLALAKYPNVYVKVSDAPSRSHQAFPFEDVHPYLRRVYDTYGPRRMIWAADITQLKGVTYKECLRLWQQGLPFLTAEDKESILGGTAAVVLRWPES